MNKLASLPKDLQKWARAAIPPDKTAWTELRPIQAKSLAWFERSKGAGDLIVCAPTAMGKTEAVFLPLIAAMSEKWPASFEILYICPLRALIDQQGKRLRSLLAVRERPVITWHGEAKEGRSSAMRRPAGLLIITPESLEAILRGTHARSMFADLSAVIVDELHSFFENERGMQVIAQMSRIDSIVGRTVPRFGLSATLSRETELAARAFLRPGQHDRVNVVSDDRALTEIRYSLRICTDGLDNAGARVTAADNVADIVARDYCIPLATSPTTTKTLMFCNSRGLVEWMTDRLRHTLRQQQVVAPPFTVEDIVVAHHGSLKAELKRAAEAALKRGDRSTFAVSSPTLELGLDVGEIERVIQVDPGPSVASLRQRLGRSGRRVGKVSELVMIVRERRSTNDDHPLASLHLALFQALAQLDLAQNGLFEVPDSRALHLSTFLQQVVSLASREDGVTDREIFDHLLDRGPFRLDRRAVYQKLLDRLTQKLGHPEHDALLNLDQATGRYRLTAEGEGMVRKPQFGVAFKSGINYVVKTSTQDLGRVPAGHGLSAGDPICFAGQRWIVRQVVDRGIPTVLVSRSTVGSAPRFVGDALAPSDLVVAKMRELYCSDQLPDSILSVDAQSLAHKARTSFKRNEIADNPVLKVDDDVVLFPWVGRKGQVALIAALRQCRMLASLANIAIIVHGQKRSTVMQALKRIATWDRLPDAAELARAVKTTSMDKHDRFLGPYLQRENYASACLDVEAAKQSAVSLSGAPAIAAQRRSALSDSSEVSTVNLQ